LKLLLDENFNNNILRGLQQRNPDLDLIRAQDVPEIAGKDDPTLLEWAANNDRVLFTHDVRTITRFAYERIESGKPMPGIVEVKRPAPLKNVIEDILLLIEDNRPEEIKDRIIYLPF
jgi:predicted nuclease of predicted toxin-antitoxin system